MKRTLLTTFIGLISGCLFGAGMFLGIGFFLRSIRRIHLASLRELGLGALLKEITDSNGNDFFWGMVLAGGLGAGIGALIGTSREIVEAIKTLHRPPEPPNKT